MLLTSLLCYSCVGSGSGKALLGEGSAALRPDPTLVVAGLGPPDPQLCPLHAQPGTLQLCLALGTWGTECWAKATCSSPPSNKKF